MSQYKRGEIYYINMVPTCGVEMRGGRPAVIVSDDKRNRCSETLEVVYLTTKERPGGYGTHVTVMGTGIKSTAICEQITTVSTERVGNFAGIASDREMEEIDEALLVSLGLEREEREEGGCQAAENALLRGRVEQIEKMYRELLERI